MDAIVVGGSVGGLSAAIALCKAGCNVTVLERAAWVQSTTGAVSSSRMSPLTSCYSGASHGQASSVISKSVNR